MVMKNKLVRITSSNLLKLFLKEFWKSGVTALSSLCNYYYYRIKFNPFFDPMNLE